MMKKIFQDLVTTYSKVVPFTVKNVALCVNLDQCNLRCVMCWQTYAREGNRALYKTTNMSRKGLLKLLQSKECADATISVVGGGEPFLYPDLDDLLRYGPNERRRLMIMTNGSLLHTRPVFWEVARTAPISIMFSIDAATAETYEKIRYLGKWNVLIENIERCIELRRENPQLQISTSFVVLKQNVHELMDFVRLNALWKSTYVHIHPAISGNYPEEDRIDPNDPDFIKTTAEVIAFCRQNFIATDRLEELVPTQFIENETIHTAPAGSTPQHPPRDPRENCNIPGESMTITHEGKIFLCDTAFRVSYTCGNVFNYPLAWLWFSPAWLSVRLAHRFKQYDRHKLCKQCLLVKG
jgi:radical SAM protein with 4Fe4S-binding SPASM domain